MNPRERTLAIALLCLILFGGGGYGAYTFFYEPYQEKKAAAQKLQEEIDKLDLQVMGMKKDHPVALQTKRASLPPDVNVAMTQYTLLMQRLLQQAKITDYTLSTAKEVAVRPPVTPEIAPKKQAYRTLQFSIEIKKANIWQVVDFLQSYYQLDLLHQITDLKISRENRVAETRNGLDVHITSEAIILDGAEPRSALFPVTTAIAAVSGMPGLQTVSLSPELTKKLTTNTANPVLAPRARDYSFIAQRDMFYGTLPVTTPVQFTIGKLSDVTIPYPYPAEPMPVRVRLAGDGSVGATIKAHAAGGLFNGDLEVNQKDHTLMLPAVGGDESDPRATSTVTVEATSAEGKKQKSSFKVSLGRKTEREVPKDNIERWIRLVILSARSDGTATAVILDSANPLKYKIEAQAKTVEVTKYYPKAKGGWGKDYEYEHPAGVLEISDGEATQTRRTFKVVAIEDDGLIVADISPPDHKDAKADGKGGGRGMGGGGMGGGRPGGGGPARHTQADPLAVVAGNVATAIPAPRLYRWENGKSLGDLVPLPPGEAKRILQRAAADGPISSLAATADN